MSEGGFLALACAAGVGLGLFYFGGLWLTVRRLPTTRWPALLTLGSLLGRLAPTLVGFYLVMAGRWERLLACLVGFVLVRLVIVAWIRPEAVQPPPPQKQGE
jgi:F1F0 ATPase subunit 2